MLQFTFDTYKVLPVVGPWVAIADVVRHVVTGKGTTPDELMTAAVPFMGGESGLASIGSSVEELGSGGMSRFGRKLADDERIVIFEGAPGTGKIKPYDPDGLSSQSLSVAGSPEQAMREAFGRNPRPGEPYWETTAGQIGATGRFAYNDSVGSPGHVSIWGGKFRDSLEFIKIWVQKTFGG